MWTWESIRRRLARSYNIQPPQWAAPSWQTGNTQKCLDELRQYVERDVEAAIDWYYAKKPWKAWASQLLKFTTLLATGLGGLLPIVSATGFFAGGRSGSDRQIHDLQVNQIGYLCFGLAAALLAFDKYFGYSTGWMRYITTAMSLETLLRNFRLDWARSTAALAGVTPSGAVLEKLLQKIEDFCIAARTLVEKETQAWVMEFQTNLSQLEKEARAAVDSARTAAEQESRATADSTRAGAINLSVENLPDLDHGYDVLIDGETKESSVTSKTWTIMDVPPGLRRLEVTSELSGKTAHASQGVKVEPASVVAVSVTLTPLKS